MNLIHRRLACLNLALLLLVLTAIPAGAVPALPAPTEPGTPAEIEVPAEPEPPAEAEDPAEAENPAEAEDPAEAEEPAEMEAPAETEAPAEAEDPAETEDPAGAENPAEAENSAEAEAPTETGDTAGEAAPEAPAPLAAQERAVDPTLYLRGSGGVQPNGAGYVYAAPVSTSNSYTRSLFYLGDYVFRRSGAVQAGWVLSTASTPANLIPLASYYHVSATYTSLTAVWAGSSSGYVILNSLNGAFRNPSDPNPSFRQQRITYQPEGAPLPDAGDFLPHSSQYALTGWSSDFSFTRDSSYVYGGRWYAPGDPAPSGVPTLYAHQYSATDSRLVVYHPGAGTVKRGGTVLVQEAWGPAVLTALEGDSLSPPEGHSFQGWSRSPGGAQAYYSPGDTFQPQAGVPLHLYAVWKKNETQIGPGLYASLDRNGQTFQLRAEAAYFTGNGYYGPLRAVLALYRDGRLLSTAVSPPQYAADVTLAASYTGGAPTECKFFVTGGDGFQPLGPAVSIDPALIS